VSRFSLMRVTMMIDIDVQQDQSSLTLIQTWHNNYDCDFG